jgi:hypothetical protein
MIFSRSLDPAELRVLGSLIEKQLTTPEYYPLTLNALVAACNQKTNRDPVMELGERELNDALIELQNMKLVWEVLGGRATHWDQNLDKALGLDPQSKAVLALLMLRGPQTPGELRGRSERLAAFQSVQDVENLLRRMASAETPLVQELMRRPGQKESRWIQLLGDVVEMGEPRLLPETAEPHGARIERIEARLEALEAQLKKLVDRLG